MMVRVAQIICLQNFVFVLAFFGFALKICVWGCEIFVSM